MKMPTQQRIWDTTSTPELWEEKERTHWIGPKLSLKKSPEKQRKEVSQALVEQEIPNHSDTCVSENTGTAPETTANCSTEPEEEFFVNNCCPDKDLHSQELQEQLKKAENELNILKRKAEKSRGKERT